MDPKKIISDAKAAKPKTPLSAYNEAISILRDKGFSWREIAVFLSERGVSTDHTKVYRYYKKQEATKGRKMDVISKDQYLEALKSIEMDANQKRMLMEHFNAPNRSITYSELADAPGYKTHGGANLQYGKLAKKIGDFVGFDYIDSKVRQGKKFHGSAIGMQNPYTEGDFQLVMHHELADAIREARNEGLFD